MAAAAAWYESKSAGLGRRFLEEIRQVASHVAENPLLWRESESGYRRVNCPVFPYYLAYILRRDTVFIVAVAHGHREPGYWRSRRH